WMRACLRVECPVSVAEPGVRAGESKTARFGADRDRLFGAGGGRRAASRDCHPVVEHLRFFGGAGDADGDRELWIEVREFSFGGAGFEAIRTASAAGDAGQVRWIVG